MKPHRNNPHSRFGRRGRRGTLLILYVAMIPISLTLLLMALTRVEIGMAENQRRELRARARLLAESALAEYESGGRALGVGETLEGRIEGLGEYRVIVGRDGETEGVLIFRGEATLLHKVDGLPFLTARCDILAETPLPDSGLPLRLLRVSHQMEGRR